MYICMSAYEFVGHLSFFLNWFKNVFLCITTAIFFPGISTVTSVSLWMHRIQALFNLNFYPLARYRLNTFSGSSDQKLVYTHNRTKVWRTQARLKMVELLRIALPLPHPLPPRANVCTVHCQFNLCLFHKPHNLAF